MTISLATKILGFLLLAAGIIIIGWTLLDSYNIFTGKAEAPAVFKMTAETVKTPATDEIQKQLESLISQQLKGMLPANSIPQLFNLIVWSVLAGILIFGGGQIANLGIKLIK
jgi:hypothetical protein